jgi:hypothetical protein
MSIFVGTHLPIPTLLSERRLQQSPQAMLGGRDQSLGREPESGMKSLVRHPPAVDNDSNSSQLPQKREDTAQVGTGGLQRGLIIHLPPEPDIRK